MNEQTNMPQINNEQKNKEQIVPTWVGILIVIALVGAFVFFFWKFQDANEKNKQIEVQAPVTGRSQEETPALQETVPPAGQTVAIPSESSEDVAQNSSTNIDIDYELKKMDESADLVNETDFDSGNFSNAQIGL